MRTEDLSDWNRVVGVTAPRGDEGLQVLEGASTATRPCITQDSPTNGSSLFWLVVLFKLHVKVPTQEPQRMRIV